MMVMMRRRIMLVMMMMMRRTGARTMSFVFRVALAQSEC